MRKKILFNLINICEFSSYIIVQITSTFFIKNEITGLKKEINFFKNKLENEETKHKETATTWQKLEEDLMNQLTQLTEKEAQARKSLEEQTNAAEGLREQLKMVQVTSMWRYYQSRTHGYRYFLRKRTPRKLCDFVHAAGSKKFTQLQIFIKFRHINLN